jgi:hypothetical protein
MSRAIGKRSTAVDRTGGIEIHIKAPRHLWTLVFLPIWLAFWTFGGFAAIRQFVSDPTSRGFLGIWLIAWLVAELLASYVWLWMAFGKEIIAVWQGALSLKRDIGGWGRAKLLRLHECRNLRASGSFGSPFSFSESLRFWGVSGGTIAVDHQGRVIRFGIGLEETEAQAVVRELAPYFPANA